MYITLDEYLEYGGQKVTDATTFYRIESSVWAKLNARTQGRIKEPLENIKRLMVELVDLEFDVRNRGVKKISNDGVSITYDDDIDTENKFESLVVAYSGKLAWRGVNDVSKTS